MHQDKLVDFHTRQYSEDLDQAHITAWLKVHNINAELLKPLPKIGYTCTMDNVPVAAAFLRLAEGDIGIFDGLCTNPLVMPNMRNMCLNFVVDRILKEAKAEGIRAIIGWTKDKNTLLRAIEFGFTQLPDAMIFLNLK